MFHLVVPVCGLPLPGSIQSAAPSAVPASPAAGCTQIRLNGPRSRSRAFMTQFKATPPARQRFSSPVAPCSQSAS